MLASKIFRVKVQHFLRKTQLLGLAEKFRYYSKIWSLKKKNNAFINQNPHFLLPPRYLAFDAYSAPDWTFYKASGEGTADFLAEVAKKYFTATRPFTSIYEWGCGPGRVVRHLPAKLGPSVQVYGSDYNPKTIEWCQKEIQGVSFFLNGLNPPLPVEDNKFDFIYSISVFTHLSEATGLNWAEELYRVLKPQGILLITTSGDNAYQNELLQEEKEKYQREGVVVRGQYEEGKKMYLARHNPQYVKEKLLTKFEILQHAPTGFPFIEQDYWIARKP
jgi:SAM-dependent methyltransferase